mgnify:FL=1
MTVYGWGFVCIILFSIYIAVRINKKTGNRKINIIFCGFISLVIICINLLAYGFAFNIVENGISMITGNKYEAVIVDYNTYKGTTTPTGSISKAPQTVYYHNPVVEYVNRQGDTVRTEVNIGERSVPVIGEYIVISEKTDGKANNITAPRSPLFFMMYLFVSLLISLSSFITLYSFNVEKARNWKLTKQVFV